MDAMITVRHDSHLGRGESGVLIAIQNWIKANPQSNCALQHDDLLTAISHGEIEGIHRDFYISTMKVYHRWAKMQSQITRMSDDSWVNLENALKEDPLVILLSYIH